MEDENEWKNLPVEEKCVHKSWKARLEGYEAAKRLFQCIDDDKSPEWSKYAGLLKKFVTDSNLTAQEKGLDAVLAYIENYVHAGRTVGEVMSNLVAKCIGSSAKPRTKELAVQISLMYVEVEKYEVVMEELLKGAESKNPKTSCGCLTILSQALRDFGPKVIGISKILKKMPAALTDRDKNVRQEARALVVEIYRWVGAPIKQQLSSLKPAQMTELEAEFDKISGPTPSPTRLLRSQQAKKIVQVAGDSGEVIADVEEEVDGEVEVDPTEFLEPVDILSKLPKKFFTQLEEKKWTERRDALETLEKELQNAPRLEPVEYGDLVRALKKVIAKDSNIVVVGIGIKCLTGLVNGLKKKFLPYVSATMPTLLEKFKEKKQNVVSPLRDAVDAIFLVAHLESLSEDIVAALDNKNPCVKNEVSLFLARCFTRCTPNILNKKLLKVLSASLLKVLNDSDPVARDAAAAALGTAMKVVGEKGIAPFLADIGEPKMTKIKACCDAAELQKPIRVASAEVKDKQPAKQPAGKPQSRPGSKTVRPVRKDASASKIVTKTPPSDLSKKFLNKIPSEILNDINDSDGNKRLQAHEQLLKYVQSNEISKDILSPLFEVLHALDDENQTVIEVKINTMKEVAEKNDLSGIDLKSTLLPLLKKYNDPKFNDCVAGCLASFSQSIGNDQFVQSLLQPSVISDKNNWATSLKWISEGIINYNLTFTEDFLQREAKKAIKSGNLVLRNAGLAMIGTMHMMNKDEPPQQKAQPNSSLQIPAKIEPTKKREAKSTDSSPSKTAVDISTVITPAVLSELSDDTWKTRFDALERIRPNIEALGQISSNLGEVQTTFENLLADKNTKVVQSTLTCLAELVKGLGIHSRKYVCFFLPKVLKNLSDPKVWVRNCVMSVLDAFGSAGGYKELFDNDTFADTCSSMTLPAAKVELFNWLTQTLNRVESVPSEGLVALLPVIYQSLEDRNADIRKSSNEMIITLMMHLGYDTMLNASSNLKGSTATLVKGLLDKNRGNIPEPVEIPVARSKSGSQLKKIGPGSTATYTKPTKSLSKSNLHGRPSVSKKEEVEVSDEALLEKNSSKNQRIMDEQKLRTLKWNFTAPRPEFIEQLKDQMNSANFNQTLISNMFHSDFKFHIKAIESLAEDLNTNHQGLISNLDLILRWMTLRFFDTNPSVLIKGLEYLLCVFSMLIDEGYNMLDIEATSFLPYLILKAGDSKDTVKNHVRSIFKQMALLYPRQKLFSIMLEGLKAKSSRLRAEVLEMLCWMITTYSIEVCSPSTVLALKEISRHIGDKDTSVRNGALNCMVAVYYIVGEDIHKYTGPLPYGPNGLLEERLKRASKNRPVASVKPLDAEQMTEVEPTIHHEMEEVSHSNNTFTVPEEEQENVENLNRTFNRLPQQNIQQNVQPQRQANNQTPQPFVLKRIEDVTDLDNYGAEIEKMLTGPYRLDHRFYEKLPSFTMPEIKIPDISFLYEPLPPRTKITLQSTPISLPSTSTSHTDDPIIKELTNPDLEMAITAMAKIETTLYSDKAYTLKSKIDYLVHQLAQQLDILNHSFHPDLVNCYRGNFSLILKFCDNKQLCEEIGEQNLSSLIKQLLMLLTENRLEKIGQEMFVKTVNNIVIRLIETCAKTLVMSCLVQMLHETVRLSTKTKFQDLVLKCLWKLNRTQAVWDQELDYPKVLQLINAFFVAYPTTWWRSQERDVPMKTMKTILHSMVKIRGACVKDELNKVAGVSPQSEIYCYINKVIRYLESSNQLPVDNRPHVVQETENKNSESKTDEELLQELTDILNPFKNSNECPEALNNLHKFKNSHPEVEIDLHLIKLPVPAILYIKRGLVGLDFESGNQTNLSKENLDNRSSASANNSTDNHTAHILTPPTSADPQVEYYKKQLSYWQNYLDRK